MDEFELFEKHSIFERYSIKEISRKTRISEIDLEYIKNDDFSKISKTKGLGFLKILEREYGVDLSDKRDKLISFLKEHDKYKPTEYFVAPPEKKSYAKLIALLFLALIIAGVIAVIYFRQTSPSSGESKFVPSNAVVNEAKELSGIEVNESNSSVVDENEELNAQNDQAYTENNSQSLENNQSEKNLSDLNTSSNIDKNDSLKVTTEENTTTKKETTPKASLENNLTKKAQKVSQKRATPIDKSISIVPKVKLWVGVVDLGNYKKRSYISRKKISIKSKSDLLITTGHGRFTLYFNGQKYDFSTKSPVRFYIKGDKLIKIDKQEFKKLNKGRNW